MDQYQGLSITTDLNGAQRGGKLINTEYKSEEAIGSADPVPIRGHGPDAHTLVSETLHEIRPQFLVYKIEGIISPAISGLW